MKRVFKRRENIKPNIFGKAIQKQSKTTKKINLHQKIERDYKWNRAIIIFVKNCNTFVPQYGLPLGEQICLRHVHDEFCQGQVIYHLIKEQDVIIAKSSVIHL